MFRFFTKKRRIAFYNRLAETLEAGDRQAIDDLLWQPEDKHIQWLPITYEILAKLKKAADVSESLTILKCHKKGRYELIIFHVPWSAGSGYNPVLADMKAEKIIGIMLPFNELHDHLPASASSAMSSLSGAWVHFIISNNLIGQH